MFKLNPNPTFKVDVEIPVPGKEAAPKIEVEYRHFTRKEQVAFQEEYTKEKFTDTELLFRVIAGWSGVDVPFTKEALDVLLDKYPSASVALFNTFYNELSPAKQKN